MGRSFKPLGFKKGANTHYSVSIPKLELAFISKKQITYGSKALLVIAMQQTFLQAVSAQKQRQFLYSMGSLEIIDKVTERQKFSKVLQRKEHVVSAPESRKLRTATSVQLKQVLKDAAEAEEEASTNANNGLPAIKEYESMLSERGNLKALPFLLLQFGQKKLARKTEVLRQYKVDVFINQIQLFYSRILISKVQTFINHATVNRAQNASAEAEFDSRLERLKQITQDKVSSLLEKSEI